MRAGAIISGLFHSAIILLAVFGGPLFNEAKTDALEITEVSLISLSDLDAALSEAPSTPAQQAPAPEIDLFDLAPDISEEPEQPSAESPLQESPDMAQLIFDESSTLDTGADLSTFEEVQVSTRTRVTALSRPVAPTESYEVLTDPDTPPTPTPEPEIKNSSPQMSAPIPDARPEILQDIEPEPVIEQPETTPDPEIVNANSAAPSQAPIPPTRKRPKTVETPKPLKQAKKEPDTPKKELSLTSKIQAALKKKQQSGPLSSGEKKAVLGQLKQKWNLRSLMGLPQAETLIVTMRVRLQQNGYIYQNKVEMIDPSSMYSPGIQVAARLAADALRASQPFDLPAGKYESWRVLEVTFNPIEMVFK